MPLSILVPVAVSLYVDRRAMVENPIQNGRSNNVISEDISPLAIGLIGCEYDRPFLMKNHSLPSNIGGIQPHAPPFDISSAIPPPLQTGPPRSIHLLNFIATLPNYIYHLLNIHGSRRGSPIAPFGSRLLASIIFYILFPVHQEMMKYAKYLPGQGDYCHVMATSGLDSKIESPELRAPNKKRPGSLVS